jgi:D-alanyl-D-alanine carboxypeptidase/D-alanyl-D-alanine-endopeptidase (penicillin-binding protein 4)
MPKWRLSSLLVCAALLASAQNQAQPRAAANAAAGEVSIRASLSALNDWVRARGGKLGAVILDVQSGSVLASAEPRLLLNPASNQKLLTAAAALRRLGPHYRYRTGAYGAIDKGIAKQLVLRGHGDPSLGMPELWRLAASLVDLGLARVDGDIFVDQSRFDASFVPPAFEQQPNEWAAFRAPVSAIALERNTLTLNVLATTAGSSARVWLDPPGAARIVGAIMTRPVGAGQDVRFRLVPDARALKAELGGHVAAGLARLRFARRVDDPRLIPGYALVHVLGALGVEHVGRVRLGGEAEKRELVRVESEPLAALLHRVGKNSDNFYAEMILKTIGAEEKGPIGTSRGGAQVLEELLQELKVHQPGTRIKNGSGLFDANRLSATQIGSLLRAMYRDPAVGPEFVAQLAIGGVDGSLRSRFRAHKNTRRVRAKTGTLRNVIALSGYVLDDGGGAVAFALLANDLASDQDVARGKLDALVERIVTEKR